MPASDPPTEITLKIKVPPGYLLPHITPTLSDSEQFTLGVVPVSTTVGALRTRVQTVVPTHPSPERQRILYGGRALVDDEQSVGDALNVKRDPTQGEYVIHVLVKGEGGSERPSRIPTPNSIAGRSQRPAPAMPPPNAAPGQPQQPNLNNPAMDQTQQHLLQHHFNQHRAMMQQHMGTAQQNGLRQQIPPQGNVNAIPGAASHPLNAGLHQSPLQTATGAHPNTQGASPAPNGPAQTPLVQQAQQQHQPQLQMPQFPQLQQFPFQPQMGPGFHVEGVGPDGQRFQIHQQTVNFPGMPFPGAMAPMPFHFPGAMPLLPVNRPGAFPPGMLAPQQMPPPRAVNAPSAVDQARENISEMRRMLDELADHSNNGTEEQRRQNIEDMQRRARSVNEYIDPLNLGNNHHPNADGNGGTAGQRQPARAAWPPAVNPLNARTPQGRNTQALNQGIPGLGDVTTDQTTAYLLSGPQGLHAILFSPEHGAYNGSLAATGHPRPTPTTTVVTANPGGDGAPPGHAADVAAQLPAAAGVPADPMAEAARLIDGANLQAAQQADNGGAQGPLGFEAILGHFWLLFRILVFAYFILGSNTGWSRIMILVGIGLGFMVVRMGALGDIGFVRRWWEGVMGIPLPPANGQAGQNAAVANAPAPVAAGQDGALPPQADAHWRRPMPTPEQVAQRLLNEAAARQQEQQGWLRGQFRAVERAAALFVASLWPGIGEGYVREQRRLREEQEAAEARQRAEADARAVEGDGQKEKESAGEGSVTAAPVESETSGEEAGRAEASGVNASS